MDCSKIKVVKKDGTKEEFNVKKVLAAISKSAERAMITFSRAEKNFICEFVEEKAEEMDQELIPIAQMHNIVEGALDKVNPLVAKSGITGIINRILCGCWIMYTRKVSPLCISGIRKTAIQTVPWFLPSAA